MIEAGQLETAERKGTYGVVYKAKDKEENRIVALKKIRFDTEDEGIPITAIREISLLKSIKHPNIVDLVDILIKDQKMIYLVFEYFEYDLKKYIGHQQKLTSEEIKLFTKQILEGLSYCHANRVIHRDLKPQNLLIDDSGNLKIIDFGLARTFSQPLQAYTHQVITLWYRAPEILLGAKIYNTSVDIWSVGAILAEMLRGKPLFSGDCEIDQIFKIFQMLGTPHEKIWPGVNQLPDFKKTFPKWKPKILSDYFPGVDHDCLDLMSKMLTYDPCQRISALEALSHPYFGEKSYDIFNSAHKLEQITDKTLF